jgi:hypothetical protein
VTRFNRATATINRVIDNIEVVGVDCFMIDTMMEFWAEPGGKENARVGAMMWWTCVPDEHDTAFRPNPHLAVMTAAGLVCLDCHESDPPYGYWTRTGDAPTVTVSPSLNINNGEWHGWLKNGQLI